MKKHSAIEILEEYKKYVWPEIDKYLKSPKYPNIFRSPAKYNKELDLYWKMVRDYPERKGKYIRPTLVVLICEAMGGKKSDALKTAAAMQLSEEWLLLDDDIMDNSQLRRGKPTFHRLYGIEQAVTIGDVLQTITTKVLSDNDKLLGYKKTKRIMDELFTIIMRTAEGQSIEFMWTSDKNFQLSNSDCIFINDGKTSLYSIAGPMRLGALVAGVNEKQLDKLTTFGTNLGRAFQLADDILGAISDFGGLKQAHTDIYEGKVTILLSNLLSKVTAIERNKVLSIYRKKMEEKSEKEIKYIVTLMNKYDIISTVKKLAEGYKLEAENNLNKDLQFLKESKARKKLEILMDFILARKF